MGLASASLEYGDGRFDPAGHESSRKIGGRPQSKSQLMLCSTEKLWCPSSLYILHQQLVVDVENSWYGDG